MGKTSRSNVRPSCPSSRGLSATRCSPVRRPSTPLASVARQPSQSRRACPGQCRKASQSRKGDCTLCGGLRLSRECLTISSSAFSACADGARTFTVVSSAALRVRRHSCAPAALHVVSGPSLPNPGGTLIILSTLVLTVSFLSFLVISRHFRPRQPSTFCQP